MKCEDCIATIEEYIDNELGDREAGRVRSHLRTCAECASVYEALEQEQLIYARYQRNIEVSPELWAAVQAKIEQEPAQAVSRGRSLRELFAGLFATPRLSFAYTVALVLIAVGATVLVMSYLQGGASNNIDQVARENGAPQQTGAPQPGSTGGGQIVSPQPSQPPATAPGQGATDAPVVANTPRPKPRLVKRPPSPEQLVREAEEKYLSAIAILTRDVNRRRSNLDPLVLAKFDTALASINRTIEDTRSAARSNPDDPIALQYMLAAYSKKVELLREMARN